MKSITMKLKRTTLILKNKTIKVKSSAKNNDYDLDLKYDYLVVGVGAQPNTFGTPGVYEYSSFLKEISDAQEIRLKIMSSIEKAASYLQKILREQDC